MVGSLMRVAMGPVSDKIGGAVLTTISGLTMVASIVIMFALGLFTPSSVDQFPMFVILMLVIFLASGAGNASTFRQFPIIFAHSARQGAGVIGWTSAIAAYGPFIWSVLIGLSITNTGNPAPFFYGIVVYYLIAVSINWYYYQRKGAEKPS
jgi:NNP family nitrate/nitrite transporter-like MFS transporter